MLYIEFGLSVYPHGRHVRDGVYTISSMVTTIEQFDKQTHRSFGVERTHWTHYHHLHAVLTDFSR
jgi:hypothetical protein